MIRVTRKDDTGDEWILVNPVYSTEDGTTIEEFDLQIRVKDGLAMDRWGTITVQFNPYHASFDDMIEQMQAIINLVPANLLA